MAVQKGIFNQVIDNILQSASDATGIARQRPSISSSRSARNNDDLKSRQITADTDSAYRRAADRGVDKLHTFKPIESEEPEETQLFDDYGVSQDPEHTLANRQIANQQRLLNRMKGNDGEWWNQPIGTSIYQMFDNRDNGVDKAGKDLSPIADEPDDLINGYEPDSYLGSWYKYALANDLPTSEIHDYAGLSSAEDWWKMMNSEEMSPWYQDVLADFPTFDEYFNHFGGRGLMDDEGSFIGEIIGGNADAIAKMIESNVRSGNWRTDSSLFDQELTDDEIQNEINMLKYMALEDITKQAIANGQIGDDYSNLISYDEASNLGGMDKWMFTEPGVANSYDPATMQVREYDEVRDSPVIVSPLAMEEHGVPNSQLHSILNEAYQGNVGYKWRQ